MHAGSEQNMRHAFVCMSYLTLKDWGE